MNDLTRWTEQLAGLEARQAEAARQGRAAEAEGAPVVYVHGRPYADPGAAASYAPEEKPRRKRKRLHRHPEEGAADAGAAAEAEGRPLSWNPYRRAGPLQRAWEGGWLISYADRQRATAPETARRGP